MKIIRPITIGDSMIVSSNVAETDYAEWSELTTYAVGNKVIVTGHTLTATVAVDYLDSHRANLIAGNAFFEANSTNLSDFVGTDDGSTTYKIELEDSAGKKAVGYIGAGGKGRQYSTNMVTNGTFDSDTVWTKGTGWTIDTAYPHYADSNHGLLISQDAGLVENQLYYALFDVKAYTSGSVALFYGAGTNYFHERTTEASFTEYGMTDGTSIFGANGLATSHLSIDNVWIRKIQEPVVSSSGGVHIVSSENGTYRQWESIEGGFNPMAIAKYTITNLVYWHKCYESLLGTNLNHFPPLNLTGSTPYWLQLEATNKWKVFDGVIGSQTSNGTYIQYSLLPGAFDSIAFFNVDATDIRIILDDPTAGVVYDQTITLNGATQAVKLDVPSYPSATVSITIRKL